jgi:hypothetical protein
MSPLEIVQWRRVGGWCQMAASLRVVESFVESSDGSQKSRKLVVNVSTEAEYSGEDTADCENLVRAVVNCSVCAYAIAL